MVSARSKSCRAAAFGIATLYIPFDSYIILCSRRDFNCSSSIPSQNRNAGISDPTLPGVFTLPIFNRRSVLLTTFLHQPCRQTHRTCRAGGKPSTWFSPERLAEQKTSQQHRTLGSTLQFCEQTSSSTLGPSPLAFELQSFIPPLTSTLPSLRPRPRS